MIKDLQINKTTYSLGQVI